MSLQVENIFFFVWGWLTCGIPHLYRGTENFRVSERLTKRVCLEKILKVIKNQRVKVLTVFKIFENNKD